MCGRRPIILQVTRKYGLFCGRHPIPWDVSRTSPSMISRQIFGDAEICSYLHIGEPRTVMKRFFKIFLSLVASVLFLQFIGILLFRWTEGAGCQYVISRLAPLFVFAIPWMCLPALLGYRLPPLSVLPLLAGYTPGVYAMFNAPDTKGWLLWVSSPRRGRPSPGFR